MKKHILILAIILIIILLAIVFFSFNYNISKESQIKNKAIGTELSFIGEDLKEHIKIVKKEDIVNIEIVECGYINHTLIEKQCYRVSVGETKEQVFWYIFYDKDSLEQVKIEQLFVT